MSARLADKLARAVRLIGQEADVANRLLVAFGDSVIWGQGLEDEHKFVNQVADAKGLRLRMHAHSGATIGVGDTYQGRCGSEAPNSYPTILQQLAACTDDPADTDLILVDGGINDIGVNTILSPFTSDAYLRNVTRRYCHDDMVTLLHQVLARFTNATTRVVVTSYFPVFSPKSDFSQVPDYLAARGLTPPPSLHTRAERELFVLRSVDLAMLFWRESRAQLARAVADAGSSRVVFADVPFTEDNAMFAPAAWLFNVHFAGGQFVPEDEVIEARHQQCVLCHPREPFKVQLCDIASAGHPNVTGARSFAETILAMA